LRGNIVLVCAGVLPAVRVRRKGVALHIDIAFAHSVLPAAGRDYTAHVSHCALAGKIPALYHGSSHVVRVCNRSRSER